MSTSNLDAMEEDSFVHVESTHALVINVTPEYKIVGTDSKHTTTQICATITARELSDDCNERSPIDIVVAIDVSGSMYGGKLELCQKTLEQLLRVLLDGDRFGLVSYASEAKVEFPMSKMTSRNKEAALRQIRSLCSGGSTNISAAIGLAFQEMRAVEDPNEVRTIFLLTDGHANAGISDPLALVELTKNCQAYNLGPHADDTSPAPKHEAIFLASFIDQAGDDGSRSHNKPAAASSIPAPPPTSMSCFGYGPDHNSQLLRDLADATQGGTYYFVEDDSGIGSAFGDAVGGLFSVVAQNTVLSVKVPPEAAAMGVRITNVHHDNAIQRDNGAYTVSVGDFYAEETRDVLVEVTLATPVSPAIALKPISHLSVSMAYTDVLEKKPAQSATIQCSIQRPSGENISKADAHVLAQWLRIMATREMMEANELAKRDNLLEAKERLQRLGRKLDDYGVDIDAGSGAASNMIQELRDDLKQLDGDFESRSKFWASGSHNLTMQCNIYKRQRRNRGSAASALASPITPRPSYTNARKMALSAKFDLSPKTK